MYEVRPGEGVGPLSFGMSRQEVEDVLGKPDEEMQWTADADDVTLSYKKTGINARLNPDDELEMVEFIGPEPITYDGDNLLEVEDPESWLEEKDDDAEIEPPDFTSETLGISFYKTDAGSMSVGVFRPGYYD